MKALPKHCLPHHAVLLLVYLSALFLTSRAANLPNLYMAFNGLVLGLSAAYLRRDFDTDLFRLKRTAANVVRQVLTGLGLGCLLAVVLRASPCCSRIFRCFPGWAYRMSPASSWCR